MIATKSALIARGMEAESNLGQGLCAFCNAELETNKPLVCFYTAPLQEVSDRLSLNVGVYL